MFPNLLTKFYYSVDFSQFSLINRQASNQSYKSILIKTYINTVMMESCYEFLPKYRKLTTNDDLKYVFKRQNDSLTNLQKPKFLLVNGNWDQSKKIKKMHKVDNEFVVNKTCKETEFIGKSSLGSDSGIDEDHNLSWLLNYKFNELPPVPDSINEIKKSPPPEKVLYDPALVAIDMHPAQFRSGIQSPRHLGPMKPPFTYTELIEYALDEKRELTVSGIYQWISEHFPFYQRNDDRWKNSVRHNLSINPNFKKGRKAAHGAGHLWTIAEKEDQRSWKLKRQRIHEFIQLTKSKYSKQKMQEIELQAATASILPPDSDYNVKFDEVLNTNKGFLSQNVRVEYINDYLITDLNPVALGVNLGEPEIKDSNIYC